MKENFPKKKKSLKRFIKSFKFSYDGIKYAFYNEQNIFVMILASIITIILAIIFDITYTERLIIILLMGMVMALELVNTAIEAIVNKVSPEENIYAKVAKDCASGAVGLMSVIAVIIGIMIFLPRIIGLF